eukprot:TRINITY_DN68998_c0_g2_i1.p1 TRINITY_DN68998_c0_g2~~TRINITY_DN68998_c0_g2_i1.p1  ORF type:complete len:105 (-),score=17.20 TRINITY_DN68998_c0_g2_i1:10-324(-)
MCNEIESYYWGSMQRRKYICEEDMANRGLWKVCGEKPKADEEYYTICGTPMSDEWLIDYLSNAAVAIGTHIFVRTQMGHYQGIKKIGRAVQQECRDRSRMPSSA